MNFDESSLGNLSITLRKNLRWFNISMELKILCKSNS